MNLEEKKELVKLAASWIGYKEKGRCNYDVYEKNDDGVGSNNFTRFGRIADIVINGVDRRIKDGYSWCAMFIIALMYELKAGHCDCSTEKGILEVNDSAIKWICDEVNGGKPLTYFAGVAAWLSAGKRQGRISSIPMPGDFAIFLNAGKGYHIGIVESVCGDVFTTIEGNTSSGVWDIVANGGCVARKKRKKSQNIVFFKN